MILFLFAKLAPSLFKTFDFTLQKGSSTTCSDEGLFSCVPTETIF